MSEPLPAPAATNTFERIKRVNQAGAEFWSARELARRLRAWGIPLSASSAGQAK